MSTDDRTQIGFGNGVQPGTQLNGIYEIDEKIAAGGMGEVYRGHNIQTGDPVAIKIVLPDFAKDPTILALFRKEASVLNHLAHNAIVRYYVFSIDPGIGRPYLAMEFVDGKSVADVLHDGPMSTGDAALLIARVASGLAAAHEAGVVHRDLSPDNIILSGGSVAKAKIIDFGIARSETIGGGTLLGGRFAGKYNFVSPEQLGLFGGDVSERSDIYSLGLVFAAALRGEALDMSGSQVDVIEKRRVVPDLSAIPEDMRPLVEAMLQPDPADRPESMSLIVEWLTPMPSWQYGGGANGEPRAQMPTSPSYPPSDRTVLTRPPVLPPYPHSKPPEWPLDPYAAPRPAASSNPFAERETTAPPGPFGQEALDGGQPAASEEEPYRYIPSNPSIPPFGDPHPIEHPDAGSTKRRSGPPLLLVAAALSLVAIAGGGIAYLFGAFSSDDSTLISAVPSTTGSSPPDGSAPGSPGGAATAPPPPTAGTSSAPPVPDGTPPATTGTQSTPSATPPTPPTGGSTATEVAGNRFAGVASAVDWLKSYDGGSCFYAHPISVSDKAMSIEGFGRSIEPFRAMDTAFRGANGYEPEIGVRQIAEKQCELADFMRTVDNGGTAAPALELSDDQIKSGESLQGVVGNIASRSVSLWLVDDQGVVYDLNQHLKRAGDRASFNIKLVDLKTGAPLPQLIFAVASDAPLVSLSHSEPMRLASFLTGLRAELSREKKTVGTAAKYFQLGG